MRRRPTTERLSVHVQVSLVVVVHDLGHQHESRYQPVLAVLVHDLCEQVAQRAVECVASVGLVFSGRAHEPHVSACFAVHPQCGQVRSVRIIA